MDELRDLVVELQSEIGEMKIWREEVNQFMKAVSKFLKTLEENDDGR